MEEPPLPHDSSANFHETLHELNQRYKQAWERAEQLQDELNDIKNSRAYRAIGWVRHAAELLRTTFQRSRKRESGVEFTIEKLELPFARACGTVSILIPFRDRLDLLRNCIRSLRSVPDPRIDLVLLDNGSTCPRTLEYLAWGQSKKLFRVVSCPGPFNFAHICNEGARSAQGEFLLFLNNDIEVLTPDWLDQLLQLGNREDVGIVGATLLYPDRTIQHAGVFANSLGDWSHVYRGRREDYRGENDELTYARTVPAVTGACLMVRRARFLQMGGFNERYPLTFNDIDLCIRVRKQGLKVAITPFARFWHFESISRGYTRDLTVPFAKQALSLNRVRRGRQA